jgi:hypothetical protein
VDHGRPAQFGAQPDFDVLLGFFPVIDASLDDDLLVVNAEPIDCRVSTNLDEFFI